MQYLFIDLFLFKINVTEKPITDLYQILNWSVVSQNPTLLIALEEPIYDIYFYSYIAKFKPVIVILYFEKLLIKYRYNDV